MDQLNKFRAAPVTSLFFLLSVFASFLNILGLASPAWCYIQGESHNVFDCHIGRSGILVLLGTLLCAVATLLLFILIIFGYSRQLTLAIATVFTNASVAMSYSGILLLAAKQILSPDDDSVSPGYSVYVSTTAMLISLIVGLFTFTFSYVTPVQTSEFTRDSSLRRSRLGTLIRSFHNRMRREGQTGNTAVIPSAPSQDDLATVYATYKKPPPYDDVMCPT